MTWIWSNSITASVVASAYNAMSVAYNPSFVHPPSNTLHSFPAGVWISLSRLWLRGCLEVVDLPLPLAYYGEEYQSTAYDIPSITVIPRESSKSFIVRQTPLDVLTKATWHTHILRVFEMTFVDFQCLGRLYWRAPFYVEIPYLFVVLLHSLPWIHSCFRWLVCGMCGMCKSYFH